MRIDVMGVGFDNVTMAQAVEKAALLLEGETAAYCVTPNAEIVYTAMQDESFRQLLNHADLVLPDGAGVVLASKILKTPLKEKVAGVDFSAQLLRLMEQTGKRLYLLGGKPGVGELAAEKMLEKHPDLQICGIADGYFKEEAPVVEKINEAKADVVFVCLGAPKQEKFMQAHQSELRVKLMLGLGGTLDTYAGTVKRAPKFFIKLYLEWFYRLLKEPKRLKRVLCLPKFIFAAYMKKIRG